MCAIVMPGPLDQSAPFWNDSAKTLRPATGRSDDIVVDDPTNVQGSLIILTSLFSPSSAFKASSPRRIVFKASAAME